MTQPRYDLTQRQDNNNSRHLSVSDNTNESDEYSDRGERIARVVGCKAIGTEAQGVSQVKFVSCESRSEDRIQHSNQRPEGYEFRKKNP